MSIEDRKQREKKALRNKIIQAASELVSREGHENVSIRKIANAVEYSPRTIYLYFRDKEHLLQEVVEAGFERTLELRAGEQEHSFTSPKELLHHRLEAHIQSALSHPNFYRAVVTLIFEKEYIPGPAQQEIINQTKQDITRCLPEERSTEEEIENSTRIVFAAARGFALSLLKINDTLTEEKREKIIARFLTFITQGLGTEEE